MELSLDELKWRCRRGMLELDLLLGEFFKHEFQNLSQEEQAVFVRLLEEPDPELFAWLMGHKVPSDPGFARLCERIKNHASI